MKDTGYVRLHRKLFHWPKLHDLAERGAWMDLVCRAAFAPMTVPAGGTTLALDRGEFAVAVRTLAEDWGWSKSKVHRFLHRLEEGGSIVTRSPGRNAGRIPAVYRIVNYGLYQGDTPASGTESGTQSGTQSGTANKELRNKELRNKNTTTTTTTPRPSPAAAAAGGSKVIGSIAPKLAPASPAEPPAEGGLPMTPAPTATPGAPRPEPKTWVAAAVAAAEQRGFYWTHARVGRALGRHVKRDGWPWVERVWLGYLDHRPYLDYDLKLEQGIEPKGPAARDMRFVRPEEFADQYGYWDRRATPRNLAALKDELAREGLTSTGDVSALAAEREPAPGAPEPRAVAS